MFKKMFGPKKIEGKGEAIPLEELRDKLLAYFPSEGEVNPFLTIEANKKSPEGFSAVWQFYSKESDMDNMGYKKCQVTHTVSVAIDPAEKAVRLKSRHFSKTTRIPRGETIYHPWQRYVKIGLLPDLIEQVEADKNKKAFSYSSKKVFEPLIACITENGWDAYKGLL